MTRSISPNLKRWATVVLAGFAVSALVACNGPTVVDAPETVGNFKVDVSMDPHTLKPAQIGTLNYALTDLQTGKPVNSFTPIFGSLVHNVLISRDLEHFRHTFTDLVVRDEVSLQAYFPITSKYTSYTLFEPEGSDLNVYTQTIQAGNEGDPPALTDDMAAVTRARHFGLEIEMFTGPEPIRAGQDSQIAFYITESGQPVTGLWPFLDEAGYLWMVDEEGGKFTWEIGTSATHTTSPTGSPAATENPSVTKAVPTSTPTIIPSLGDDLATRTAQPISTLPPVQETAQVSITEPQVVKPDTTYGPYVLFGHRFPEPGLYKMWFEFKYRNEVVDSDWVVRVEP